MRNLLSPLVSPFGGGTQARPTDMRSTHSLTLRLASCFTLLLALLLGIGLAPSAHAQTDFQDFQDLHDFGSSPTDGANPNGTPTLGSDGKILYGMMPGGGANGVGQFPAKDHSLDGAPFKQLYGFNGGTSAVTKISHLV